MLVDPDGRVFAVHMGKKTNKVKERKFVQILPDSKRFEELLTLTKNSNSYNAATYIEDDGVPYALLSQGFGTKAKKINLTKIDEKIAPISLGENTEGPNNDSSKVKDFIWVQEGLTVDNHKYFIVGIRVADGTLEALSYTHLTLPTILLV